MHDHLNDLGRLSQHGPDDLEVFFESVMRPIRLRTRSDNTIRLYRFSLACYTRHLDRRCRLSDLTDDAVSRFLDARRRAGLSSHAVARDRQNLLAIWRYAQTRGLIQRGPEVEPEKIINRAPLAWMPDDMQKLMAACRARSGWVAGIPARDWWVALVLFAWDSGERINAILGLAWADVDLRRKIATCRAESRKNGTDDRVYKLSTECCEALRQIRTDQPRVFPWALSRNSIWRHFGEIVESAGLTNDRASKFHRLRRSVASHFAAAGGDATAMLGHSSAKVTKRYLDPRIVAPPSPTQLLFRIG